MIDVIVEESKGIKRATGIIRQGTVHINVPRHWSRIDKQKAVASLQNTLLRKAKKEESLLAAIDRWLISPEGQGQCVTIDSPASLDRYVRQLNAETLQVPLAKVRIGQAKFSRLAQMNIESQTMSISIYCLRGVPEPALRYLIIHELAHLIEANHSQRFWRLVAQFVPDYKHQSQIIKAFHQRAVDLAEPTQTSDGSNLITQPSPQQLKPVDQSDPFPHQKLTPTYSSLFDPALCHTALSDSAPFDQQTSNEPTTTLSPRTSRQQRRRRAIQPPDISTPITGSKPMLENFALNALEKGIKTWQQLFGNNEGIVNNDLPKKNQRQASEQFSTEAIDEKNIPSHLKNWWQLKLF